MAKEDISTSFLKHTIVPQPARGVVKAPSTVNQIRDYAAQGFHVCVDQGLAALKDALAGTGSPKIVAAWNEAARLYQRVYYQSLGSIAYGEANVTLAQANKAAANALSTVGVAVEVNRDGTPNTVDVADKLEKKAGKASFPWLYAAAAIAVGAFLALRKKRG